MTLNIETLLIKEVIEQLGKLEEKFSAKFDNETLIHKQNIEKIKDQNIIVTNFLQKIEKLPENMKEHLRLGINIVVYHISAVVLKSLKRDKNS
jgi:predicted peroxiredoxin